MDEKTMRSDVARPDEERPDVDQLLADMVEHDASGLLTLLCAIDDSNRDAISAQLWRPEVAWAELAAWVRAWPTPPQDAADFIAWMRETEDLALALRHLGEVDGHDDDDAVADVELPEDAFRAAAEERLAEFETVVTSRQDAARFGAEAEARLPAHGELAPWSWLAIGDLESLVSTVGVVAAAGLAIDRRLGRDAEAAFVAATAREGELRDAYRNEVAARAARVDITRWTADWSPDVALDEGDFDMAAVLLDVYLPHQGDSLRVVHHHEGAIWRLPGQEPAKVNADAHVWGDEVLGEIKTAVHLYEPSEDEDAWHGVGALLPIAFGRAPVTPRTEPSAVAVASAIADGRMGEALGLGHNAFETGEYLEPIDERLVSHAFVGRMALTDISRHLSNAGQDIARLMQAIERVDEVHRAHGSAVFFVPDEVHAELCASIPLDPHEWWGVRDAVERAVPSGLVEAGFNALRSEARKNAEAQSGEAAKSSERAGVVVRVNFGAKTTESAETAFAGEVLRMAAASDDEDEPCSWLPVPQKEVDERAPVGCVPLLIHDVGADRGLVFELRVAVAEPDGDAAVFSAARELRTIAQDTIRDAYRAAKKAMGDRVVVPPFVAHRVRLVRPKAMQVERIEVDGRSVGLSAALAFVSAWTQQGLALNVAATAAIDSDGAVHPVGAVRAKGDALRSAAPASTLLVHQENAGDAAGSLAVSTLAEAREKAGLNGAFALEARSENERKKRLSRLSETVAEDTLAEGDTWQSLGDEMLDLIETLESLAHVQTLREARIRAAMAYTHAGDSRGASRVLKGIERASMETSYERALYDVTKLGVAIDEAGTDAAQAVIRERLSRELVALEQSRREFVGRALGTLGRSYLHAGDPEVAIPLLEDAVASHALCAPHETARSRIYLSMALRNTGRPDEALAELMVAERELSTKTRQGRGYEYEQSCRMFFEYELARVKLALGRYDDAIEAASAAIESCGWRWWPKLGALRTRAWAHRMNGDDVSADSDVEVMRELRLEAWANEWREKFVAEAEGYPVDDGEVY